MKRGFTALALVLALAASPAIAVQVGAGVSGGASFSRAQSDNGNGGHYGLYVPIEVHPFLTIEPFLTRGQFDETATTFAGQPYSRRGLDMLSYGANVVMTNLTARVPVYPFFGMGYCHSRREGTGGSDDPEYRIGLGYALPLPFQLALDVRSDFRWVSSGATARRFFEVAAGLSVHLYPGPEVTY